MNEGKRHSTVWGFCFNLICCYSDRVMQSSISLSILFPLLSPLPPPTSWCLSCWYYFQYIMLCSSQNVEIKRHTIYTQIQHRHLVCFIATHHCPSFFTWYKYMSHYEDSWRIGFHRYNEETHRVMRLPAALTITLCHASSVNLMTGRDRFRIECVCCATVMERGSRNTFSSWLQSEEKMVYPGLLSLEKLHFEHHASMRQRSYLHRTLAGTKSLCCCLGSMPLNAYQSRNAGMSWQPADIDIFVLDECVLDDLCTDYAVHVCDPLGLRMVRCGRNWLCSMNDVEDIGSEPEIPVDTTVETNHLIEVGMALSEHIRRKVVHTLVSLFQSLSPDDIDEYFEELVKTIFRIPHCSSVRPYTVIKSVRLSVESRSDHSEPSVLLPINIIVVRPDRGLPKECYNDLAKFREFIASGFDLLHCCIALSVTDELTFLTSEAKDGAYALARSSKMQWVNVFNGSEYSTVLRIYKYIRRGFKWSL